MRSLRMEKRSREEITALYRKKIIRDKMAESRLRSALQSTLFLADALKRYIHLIKKITHRTVKSCFFSFFFMSA